MALYNRLQKFAEKILLSVLRAQLKIISCKSSCFVTHLTYLYSNCSMLFLMYFVPKCPPVRMFAEIYKVKHFLYIPAFANAILYKILEKNSKP